MSNAAENYDHYDAAENEDRRDSRKNAPEIGKQISMKFTDIPTRENSKISEGAGGGNQSNNFSMSFGQWSVSDSQPWTCVSCTYVNDNPLFLTCEMCGQDKPPKEHLAAAADAANESMSAEDFERQRNQMAEAQNNKLLQSRYKEIQKHQLRTMTDLLEDEREGENDDDDENNPHRKSKNEIPLENLKIEEDDGAYAFSENYHGVSDNSMINILEDQLDVYKRASTISDNVQFTEEEEEDSARGGAALSQGLLNEKFLREQQRLMEGFTAQKRASMTK